MALQTTSIEVEDIFFINCSNTVHRVPIEGIYKYSAFALFGFAEIVFIPCGILNLLLLIAILRKKTLRTLPNYLMVNVLLDDLLISVVTTIWCSNFILALYRKQNCILYITSASVCYMCACLAVTEVVLLAVERYIAIFHPWHYFEKKKLIRHAFITTVVIIWIISFVVGAVSFLMPQFQITKIFIAGIIPISVILSIVMHIKLFFLVKEKQQQMKRDSVTVLMGDPRTEVMKTQDRRLHVITSLVILQLIICYLPFCLVIFYKTLIKSSDKDIAIIFNWAAIMAALKAFSNPLTLLYQLKSFRTALRELLSGKTEKNIM